MAKQVIHAINTHSKDLEAGALLTIDPGRKRIKLLPLG